MLIMMWATVLPMAALLAWVWPALVAAWRQACLVSCAGLVLLWLTGAGLLLFFPHEDGFTGLDNMTYRLMSQAFLDGRGFHDTDKALAQVPMNLREDFLLHRGPVGRPTRDRVFQLSGWTGVKTEPFFLPVLPLAAAGLEPVMAPERFVPLVGAFWLALVLAAGFCAGGGWGLVVVAALALGTAWPAWFLRGFYAEAVGAVLVAGVVAAAAVRSLSKGMIPVAGFVLGLAISYHPAMSVLSIPVALALAFESGDKKTTLMVLGGVAVGLIPFLAVNCFVCRPYGDFASWEHIRRIVTAAPEHRALATVIGVLAIFSISALCVGSLKSMRHGIAQFSVRWRLRGWLLLCVMPLLLLAIPGDTGRTICEGAAATWSGIRWPYAMVLIAGMGFVLPGDRPAREGLWVVMLCWVAVFFMFVKGVETPVGLWSQRRFLPVVLVGVAVLAAPLSAGMSSCMVRWRPSGWGWAIFLVVAGLWNVVHWPAAYFTINERGATEWTRSVGELIGTNRWVVFDYYPHSVPYAAGLKQKVLGLGEPSHYHWPEVAGWIGSLAKSGEVWVATSWAPCTLEDGFILEEVFAKTGRFPVVTAKAFFPAERGARLIENHFLRVVPLSQGESFVQNKVLDGSPVGLRGTWGVKNRDIIGLNGMRVPAMWSRDGSGIVGPVPRPGKSVKILLEAAASRDDGVEGQILKIKPPWGGDGLLLPVSNSYTRVEGELFRSPDLKDDGSGTGVYRIFAETPYDPLKTGTKGYEKDLGARIHMIRIECLAAGPEENAKAPSAPR